MLGPAVSSCMGRALPPGPHAPRQSTAVPSSRQQKMGAQVGRQGATSLRPLAGTQDWTPPFTQVCSDRYPDCLGLAM